MLHETQNEVLVEKISLLPKPQLLLFESKFVQDELALAFAASNSNNIFTDFSSTSILHVVQMSRIFSDCKTFVDMKMRRSPNIVQNEFSNMMLQFEQNPPKDRIADFVRDNFTLADQMEHHEPTDWVQSPKFIDQITDPAYRKFAYDLNQRWKTLGRKISEDVAREPELYSLIYLPYPVIVPGGRFREVYYWDSFWIIRGLLLCEMYSTVKGMLLNFVHLIGKFGKIPNGGRTYFVNRSQPPLFVQMVDEYAKATGDWEFVEQIMPYMVQEFNYWIREHLVTICKDNREYRLARFNCEDPGPRPESYVEDYELSHTHAHSAEERAHLYYELKTGAETGWDYSSRWMIKECSSANAAAAGLEDTKARYIIPVDLNAFMTKNATLLSGYAKDLIHDDVMSKAFNKWSSDFKEAMDAVLWNEEDGIWYDFDFLNMKQRKSFAPSNVVPLWTQTYSSSVQVTAAVSYLKRQELLELFPGGVPTTYCQSGQQWDFPNCWPPLEHMMVQGLERTGIPEAKEMAFKIAEKRVRGAFANFFAKGHMFEKYDASSMTKIGGGGEYEIQIGFGWSNGVVLDFLNQYSSGLSAPELNLNLTNLSTENVSSKNDNEEYYIH